MTIPTRELPHLSPLVRDYFYDYGKVREFYGADFRDLEAFGRQAERVRSRRLPREELTAILTRQNEGYGCGPRTLGEITKIARDEACAVVTGQQVGLFSGPLYTIHKALTAIKLAEHLNRTQAGRYVPVFWMASDDHDLAEIDHIALIDKSNELQEIRCSPASSHPGIPASEVLLPQGIGDCVRRLEEFTLDSEFKADVLDRLREAYEPGRSFVEAFARWMTRLFGSRGLILIDASLPGLKDLASEVFRREIAEESPSTREAMAATNRLRQAGYEGQVPLHEGILNIFYADRERRSIQSGGGSFRIKGESRPLRKEELLALAGEKPSRFSPNVVLRPIFQDALLPTVAYVGGQAEIAYFAQLKGVYESFGLPMPVIYPRKSVTILESKIDRILKKYKLEIPDLWHDPAGILGKIASGRVPEALGKAMADVSDNLERDLDALKREALAFEPGLKGPVDLAKGKVSHQLAFLEKKILQAARQSQEIAARQIRKAVDNIFPNQRLQERVFNVAPYLIKYGDAFLERLDKAMDVEVHDHQVMLIGGV